MMHGDGAAADDCDDSAPGVLTRFSERALSIEKKWKRFSAVSTKKLVEFLPQKSSHPMSKNPEDLKVLHWRRK